jgi:hypothetical protein
MEPSHAFIFALHHDTVQLEHSNRQLCSEVVGEDLADSDSSYPSTATFPSRSPCPPQFTPSPAQCPPLCQLRSKSVPLPSSPLLPLTRFSCMHSLQRRPASTRSPSSSVLASVYMLDFKHPTDGAARPRVLLLPASAHADKHATWDGLNAALAEPAATYMRAQRDLSQCIACHCNCDRLALHSRRQPRQIRCRCRRRTTLTCTCSHALNYIEGVSAVPHPSACPRSRAPAVASPNADQPTLAVARAQGQARMPAEPVWRQQGRARGAHSPARAPCAAAGDTQQRTRRMWRPWPRPTSGCASVLVHARRLCQQRGRQGCRREHVRSCAAFRPRSPRALHTRPWQPHHVPARTHCTHSEVCTHLHPLLARPF